MKKYTKTLLAISLLAVTGASFAVPLTGSINIGGQAVVLNDGTNSTGIDFGNGEVNNFPAPTGDFTGLGGINTTGLSGDTLILTDFLYTQIPSVAIWAIDLGNDSTIDYSFTLESVSVTSGDSGNFSNLVLNGTGYFMATGFDKTFGNWTYSQSGLSFSSESVPEPALLSLMGLGLIGFGAARKMRKAA